MGSKTPKAQSLFKSITYRQEVTPYAGGKKRMYLCYVDESGTPELPGNTSHFILAAIAIPIWHWRDADYEVSAILRKYGLEIGRAHV